MTVPTPASPAALRQLVTAIDGSAQRTLKSRWISRDDLALAEIIDSVVLTHGDAASVVAADWYDLNRSAAQVPGGYRAEALRTPGTGSHGLVAWAQETATTAESMQSLILGGVTKRIAGAARMTIADNAAADPRADGWQRVASGASCLFCRMLADRGGVYTADTSHFASHDHCKCSAVPAWGGRPRLVSRYTKSIREASDADRERVRDWIAANREYLSELA